MNFIEGKWYIYNKGEYYLRCCKSGYTVSTIYYSEYIKTSDKGYRKLQMNSNISNSNVSDIEVSLIDIQQYLPEGHVDLLPVFTNSCTNYLIKYLKNLKIK